VCTEAKEAFDISLTWYKCKGIDISLFHDISLGYVFQVYIYEKLYPKANSVDEFLSLTKVIKHLGYDWQVRFFHSKLLPIPKVKQYDVIMIYDVNNKPMIKNLNLVAEELLKRKISVAALTVDSKIKSQILPNIPVFFLSKFYNFSLEKDVYKNAKLIRDRLRQYENCVLSNFKRKRYISDKSIEKALKYYYQQIPQALREIFSAEQFLKEISPKIILSSSDAHRISRMIILLAKKKGIKTFVIQHGASVWEYAYIPVTADKIFVWGEESKKWFIDRGTPTNKLIITGCPRYDSLKFEGEKYIKEFKRFSRNLPNICLFTNPIDLSTNRRILKAFLSLPKKLFKKIFVKIHPSENKNFYEKLISSNLKENQVKILHSVGISKELEPGDIAIVGNSTIGIEAIAQGLILVNLELKGFPNPIPYSKYDAGLIADEHSLRDAIKSALLIRASQERYSEYIHNCEVFLKNYLYTLDGKATTRITDFIEQNLINLEEKYENCHIRNPRNSK